MRSRSSASCPLSVLIGFLGARPKMLVAEWKRGHRPAESKLVFVTRGGVDFVGASVRTSCLARQDETSAEGAKQVHSSADKLAARAGRFLGTTSRYRQDNYPERTAEGHEAMAANLDRLGRRSAALARRNLSRYLDIRSSFDEGYQLGQGRPGIDCV
jgi:hypothetical protein